MRKKSKEELYMDIYYEADDILKKVGIKDICFKCSTIKPIKGKMLMFKTDSLGCCSGCKYLGKTGCKTFSLPCKFWLCDALFNFNFGKYKKRWDYLIKLAKENNFYDNTEEDFSKRKFRWGLGEFKKAGII
jgi:hypothetical protein